MIRISGLTKRFGPLTALENVSLKYSGIEPLAVLGPSGSGKTTLLRLIAGLERPDAGTIHMNDRLVSNPQNCLAPHKRGIGFVFQQAALWPHLSVAQNILFGLKHLSRQTAHQRLADVLEQTGLVNFNQRYPDQLSGGEARRVALARAIAPQPALLLMDEPLVHLDQTFKDQMIGLIFKIVQRSKTALIYVTHDPVEALRICPRLVELEGGKLISNRTPARD